MLRKKEGRRNCTFVSLLLRSPRPFFLGRTISRQKKLFAPRLSPPGFSSAALPLSLLRGCRSRRRTRFRRGLGREERAASRRLATVSVVGALRATQDRCFALFFFFLSCLFAWKEHSLFLSPWSLRAPGCCPCWRHCPCPGRSRGPGRP